MSLFKNIIILLTLISFFSCAPTTIEKKKPIEKAPEKVEEIEIVEEKEAVSYTHLRAHETV